jgi:AbrB family looped-hinge helix DNA binding protein
MMASIDKFGRVLIPKSIRDHLGTQAGTLVQILEHDHEILLKLVDQNNPLQLNDGVLTFTGEATEDIENAINAEQEKRLKDFFDT